MTIKPAINCIIVFKSDFKKHKNGFVEQGGNITSSANIMTVLLLVEMSKIPNIRHSPQYKQLEIIFCPPNTENSIQVRITSGSDFQPVSGKKFASLPEVTLLYKKTGYTGLYLFVV